MLEPPFLPFNVINLRLFLMGKNVKSMEKKGIPLFGVANYSYPIKIIECGQSAGKFLITLKKLFR